MRLFLLLALVGCSFLGNAQSKIQVEAVFGIHPSRVYSRSVLLGLPAASQLETSSETGGHIGILLTKQVLDSLGEHGGIGTRAGIGFLLRRYSGKIACDCTQWPSEHNSNGGYQRDPALDDAITFQDLFLEIPVFLRQHFYRKHRISPFVEFGLVNSFLIKKDRTVTAALNPDLKTAGNQNQFLGHFAAGVAVKTGSSSALSLTVFYSPTHRNDPFFYASSIGGQVGYRF